MIQVWLLDDNNFFTGESKFVDKVSKNMTNTPLLVGYVKPLFDGLSWMEGATEEEIQKWKYSQQIVTCLDNLKLEKIKHSKSQLESWLHSNPLFSTVHNPQGEYYTVTDEKQSLLARNLLLAQLSQSTTTTWNSTSNVCEEWDLSELSKLALEIEAYVRPRITKQQHYEVEINSCQTKEELELITFEYGVI